MRLRAVVALVVIAVVAGYGLARAMEQVAPAPVTETVNGITYHMPFGRPTRPFTPAVQTGNLMCNIAHDAYAVARHDCNGKLIHRLSTLRPRAYIIVFSDNSKVKGAVGADFGVYVYPTENIK